MLLSSSVPELASRNLLALSLLENSSFEMAMFFSSNRTSPTSVERRRSFKDETHALMKRLNRVRLKQFGRIPETGNPFLVKEKRLDTGKEKKSDSNRVVDPSRIRVDLCGFRLDSPTMLASGVLGISFDLFPRIINSGCGAIVSKSIGLEPREGYRNPTMTAVEAGYLNAIGLANPGAKEFARELEETRNQRVPLIVSIFADSALNFARLAEEFEPYNFLAFELNLSCPHVKEVGSEIGTDPKNAAEVVEKVKSVTKKPVFAKMPATIPNVPLWAKSVEQAGADAIVAINTIRAMKIDIETRKPILSNKIGGLSGPAIKSVGVRSVYEIYESVEIPVIGVGGISTWGDALEYHLAGATCVQIGSAMGPEFLSVFGQVNQGIARYISDHHFSNLRELIGAAHS